MIGMYLKKPTIFPSLPKDHDNEGVREKCFGEIYLVK